MASPDALEKRYGAPSRSRRLGLVVTAVVVSLGFLAWLAWAAIFHANPEVASKELTFDVVDDHLATITVRIDFDDAIDEAKCQVRAISHDKAIVGELTYTATPDAGPDHTIDIKTVRRATTVDWIGCKAPGQPRFR